VSSSAERKEEKRDRGKKKRAREWRRNMRFHPYPLLCVGSTVV